MKAKTFAGANKLQDIPNIGPSIADDLRALGIERPSQLVGKYPYALCSTWPPIARLRVRSGS